jgi:hypothetical protein
MIEAARTSETSVDNYFTRKYIPEDKSEFPAVYQFRQMVHCPVHKSPPQIPILRRMNRVNILWPCFFHLRFNIIPINA